MSRDGRDSVRRTQAQAWQEAEAPISPKGADFLDYWRGKCPPAGLGRRFPVRSEIRPEEIVRLLPYVFMLDVVRGGEGLDFEFRLVGTAIAAIEGELTGRLMSEMFPDRDIYAVMWKQYVDAVEGNIWVRHETLSWLDRDHVNYEVVLAPLENEAGEVDILIGIAHAQDD